MHSQYTPNTLSTHSQYTPNALTTHSQRTPNALVLYLWAPLAILGLNLFWYKSNLSVYYEWTETHFDHLWYHRAFMQRWKYWLYKYIYCGIIPNCDHSQQTNIVLNSFRDTPECKELLGKTMARQCTCEGHINSLATSPKGHVGRRREWESSGEQWEWQVGRICLQVINWVGQKWSVRRIPCQERGYVKARKE